MHGESKGSHFIALFGNRYNSFPTKVGLLDPRQWGHAPHPGAVCSQHQQLTAKTTPTKVRTLNSARQPIRSPMPGASIKRVIGVFAPMRKWRQREDFADGNDASCRLGTWRRIRGLTSEHAPIKKTRNELVQLRHVGAYVPAIPVSHPNHRIRSCFDESA